MAKTTSNQKTKKKNTPRPAPKKRKTASRRSKFVTLTIQILIVLACALLFWIIYLNAVVRDRFEGKRFQIPARVYSEAQELYVGAPVRQNTMQDLLNQLGYRPSAVVSHSGRYQAFDNSISVYTRGFQFWDGEEPSQKLNIQFGPEGIERMTTLDGNPVLLARLDPLYMGQIYPGISEDRVLYQLKDIPEQMVLGLLLVEDDRFFEHWGISFRGIARALLANLSAGRASQGGSTLTNQLVKNLYLSPEKTITRKVNEALMSLLLEYHYSKNDILETYMNEVYIGQQGVRSINGFGLGAQFYFGTNLQGLEIHQQAMLVGLIKGPSYYNPRRNPERAKKRRDVVLDVWHQRNLISDEEYKRAIQSPLDTANTTSQTNYPAFMDSLRRQLARDYRKEDLLDEGLQIFTTLDPVAQAILENEMSVSLDQAEKRYGLAPDILQGAGVLTRPSTADVIAMTGSRNPNETGFNRALDAYRPVGSLMKPAVFLAAIEKGWTLADTISDATVTIAAGDGSTWQPKNYDLKEHGYPMLVDALAKSYNQATARLGMEVGLANVFDVIDRMGVSDRVPLVPSVMLGAHGMSPFEVAQMYQSIAGNGFYSSLNLIRAVSHPTKGVIQRFDLKVDKRFSPEDIHILQTAMHEATVSGTAAKIQQQLPSDWWVAGKTGTTDDYRDAWFSGFTGDRQLVIWVGRDNNQPTPLTGSTGALPIWMNVMDKLQPVQERRGTPAKVTYIEVNNAGVDVPDWCGEIRSLPFVIGSEPMQSLSCSSQIVKPETEKRTWWQKVFR